MNMKKVLVLVCVAWMGAGAFASTFMGPATAELIEGEWKVGYTFSYAEMDIDVDSPFDTLDDVELTRHYFNLGMGAFKNFEFNILLGSVGVDVDSDDLGTTDDYESSGEFSGGFNVKYTFAESEKIDWGAMYQMTYFSAEDTVDGADIELDDVYDIQIAIGPKIDLGGGFDIYGGGFFYMLDGDIDVSGVGSLGFEEESNFGGHIGIQYAAQPGKADDGRYYDPFKGIIMALEAQFTGDAWGFGGTLGWRF